MTELRFKTFSKSLPRVRKEVKGAAGNRQRTPGTALRGPPTSGFISFSLAKFGRLNCLQGTQIAGNVVLTLEKYYMLVSPVSTLIPRAFLVSVAPPPF
jgi:hypothetical protein